jgi:hypothetical protein
MNHVTSEEYQKAKEFLPEIQMCRKLCKDIIAHADLMEDTQDPNLAAVRRSMIRQLMRVLVIAFVKQGDLIMSVCPLDTLMNHPEMKAALVDASSFAKLADDSASFEEKLAEVREIGAFWTKIEIEQGAAVHLEVREDGHYFAEVRIADYFVDFYRDFIFQAMSFRTTYNKMHRAASAKQEHMFELTRQRFFGQLGLLYNLVLPVVQILNKAPELTESLHNLGIEQPEELAAFVQLCNSKGTKESDYVHALEKVMIQPVKDAK